MITNAVVHFQLVSNYYGTFKSEKFVMCVLSLQPQVFNSNALTIMHPNLEDSKKN